MVLGMEEFDEERFLSIFSDVSESLDCLSENIPDTSRALKSCFISKNVTDSNNEAANLVDTSDEIRWELHAISCSIDDSTKAFNRIADALFEIMSVLRDK